MSPMTYEPLTVTSWFAGTRVWSNHRTRPYRLKTKTAAAPTRVNRSQPTVRYTRSTTPSAFDHLAMSQTMSRRSHIDAVVSGSCFAVTARIFS